MGVALLSAYKAHKADEDVLKRERAVFASKHGEHDKGVLTPMSSEFVFNDYMAEVKELHTVAKRIQHVEVSKVAKKKALDAAQVAYDAAAEHAILADEKVVVAQELASRECGHGVAEHPLEPEPSSGPSSGTDLGYNHPVTCSSGCRKFYGDAELASNGVVDETNGARRQSGGLAHTNSERDAWVEVDFEEEFKMGKVTFWNGWQWGCCMDLINPYRLVFLDATHNEVSRVTGLQAKTAEDGETPVTLDSPVLARFVRVQLDNHANYLHIAELRAYAA